MKKNQSSHKSKGLRIEKNNKPRTIYYLLARIALLTVIVVGCVFYTDRKGYFNPDYTNDHTRRKWNAYYEFIKKQPVDVVMVGNSHLYTGLNPDNLSNTLGANCFILASPGTTLTDAYFCLKEAISTNRPKVAIVETFTIFDYDNHTLKKGQLSDQFKSFSARKNVAQKLSSMPCLFISDNYLAAWSNTIRNHNFLFTDREQIRRNRNYKEPPRPGLYLGRYNRFMTGLEDSTLLKYDKPGFIGYDYAKNMPSPEAKTYIRKTIELCKRNNVQLVFFTLPMYHRHVHNYDTYKKELKRMIGTSHWVDFQIPYDTVAFNVDCFENTVAGNQHMTYYGARVAAYKLAHYLKKNIKDLPNRSANLEWKRTFYASDGYFENYSPVEDGVSQLLMQNVHFPDNQMVVKEISLVPYSGSAKKLIVKVEKQHLNQPLFGKTVRLQARINVNGQAIEAELEAACTYAYAPEDFYVFVSEPLNPAVTVQQIMGMRLL